jgi:hypothetical protein
MKVDANSEQRDYNGARNETPYTMTPAVGASSTNHMVAVGIMCIMSYGYLRRLCQSSKTQTNESITDEEIQ